MDHQFSLEHIARLRDIAASLDSQAVACETALGNLLSDAGLGSDAAMDLRRAARQHTAATARMVVELGDRQDRGGVIRSLPYGVLVVDDYRDSRESLALVMENAGYIVRTSTNGLEATRLIKAVEELRHTCVIAYTAMPAFDSDAFAPLFSEVIQKPAPPDVLLAAVHRFLPS